MDDFDRAQKLCEKYKAWKDEIAKKYLSFDPVDAFMAGYELGFKECENRLPKQPEIFSLDNL